MNSRAFGPLSICLVLVGWLMAAIAIPALPPVVPTSFGLDGAPTATSSPASLWYLPVLLTVMYLFLTALQFVPQERLNVPVTITDRNRDRIYALARELSRAVRAGVLIVIVCIEWAIFHVAGRGSMDTSFVVSVIVPVIGVFGWIASFIVRMARA